MFNSFPIPKPDSGGSNIKSIQSGTGTFTPSGSATMNIPITSIDLTKSIVTISYDGNVVNGALHIRAKITTATNLQLLRGLGHANPVNFSWTIVEYNVVKSLQTGQKVVIGSTPGPFTVTISAVNPAKSILFASFSTDANVGFGSAAILISRLINGTTINFDSISVTTNNLNFTIEWQVIEFN